MDFQNIYILLYVCVYLIVCACASHACRSPWMSEKEPDPMKLGLQMFVNYYVGSGNQAQSSLRAVKVLKHWQPFSPSPQQRDIDQGNNFFFFVRFFLGSALILSILFFFLFDTVLRVKYRLPSVCFGFMVLSQIEMIYWHVTMYISQQRLHAFISSYHMNNLG